MTENVESLYGVDDEAKAIWVFLEQMGGSLEGVGLELLAQGRRMADDAGWQVVALLLGLKIIFISFKILK